MYRSRQFIIRFSDNRRKFVAFHCGFRVLKMSTQFAMISRWWKRNSEPTDWPPIRRVFLVGRVSDLQRCPDSKDVRVSFLFYCQKNALLIMKLSFVTYNTISVNLRLFKKDILLSCRAEKEKKKGSVLILSLSYLHFQVKKRKENLVTFVHDLSFP